MEEEGLLKTRVVALFYRLFFVPEKRRFFLCQWHTKKAKSEHDTLYADFRAFIQTILYEPVCFHMLSDHFTLFGPTLPIRYAWIEEEVDKKVFFHLFKERKRVFVNQKDLHNNQFDYSTLLCIKDSELVDVLTKRQIVRDFVWICCERNESYIILALIKAIQSLLAHAYGKGDVFLESLHQALQGKTDVYEVIC
jgi:hypothetical protein